MSETYNKLGITVHRFVCIFPECPPGSNNGALIIEATAVKKIALQYSINGGETYQSDGTFEGLGPGEYDIRIRFAEQPKNTWEYKVVEFPAPLCEKSCVLPKDACGTMLYPGDLSFWGFDNNYYYGDDRMIITTLVELKPYTQFVVTNGVFEAGAAANQRTNRWYGPNGRFDAEITSQRITYIGKKNIGAGSIICFDLPSLGTQVLARNFKINGAFSSLFCVEDIGNAPLPRINISTSEPDAVFLMQGDWTFHDAGYGTFCGRVLSGFQNGGLWHEFEEAVPQNTRRSRRPPAINCLAIQGLDRPQSIYTYFRPSSSSYFALSLLNELRNYNNWLVSPGSGQNDLPREACLQRVKIEKTTIG
ncbi:MAG: hypothetical protein AAGG75_19550 [Bacteroidota bacterium]